MSSTTEYFWGAVDASVNWCEGDYGVSPYVAEFWNTVSSLFMALLGFVGLINSLGSGLPGRFHWGYVSLITVGVGSAMFHGSLRHAGQAADELSMVVGICMFLWQTLDERHVERAKLMSSNQLLAVFTTVFVALATLWAYTWEKPILFQASFVSMELLEIYLLTKWYNRAKELGTWPEARRVFRLSQWCEGIAVVCWLTDHALCRFKLGIEFHALWHTFMAVWAYARIVLLSMIKSTEASTTSELALDESLLPMRWWHGVLPINARVSHKYKQKVKRQQARDARSGNNPAARNAELLQMETKRA